MTSNGNAYLGNTKKVEGGLLRLDISYPESQRIYNQWAKEGTYDKMLENNPKEYNGLIMYTEGMRNLFSDLSKVKVLDIGTGTGLSGQKLLSLGYEHVDGLEPAMEMVGIIKKKDIYRKIIETPIVGTDSPLDVPDDYYDAVCTTGCFGPGHIPCSAVYDMVRIVRPGGYILNCMREEFLWSVPEYKDRLVPLFNDLVSEGKLERVEWTRYPNHFVGLDGIRMIFKVL